MTGCHGNGNQIDITHFWYKFTPNTLIQKVYIWHFEGIKCKWYTT